VVSNQLKSSAGPISIQVPININTSGLNNSSTVSNHANSNGSSKSNQNIHPNLNTPTNLSTFKSAALNSTPTASSGHSTHNQNSSASNTLRKAAKSLDENFILLGKDIGKQIDIDIENSNLDDDDDDNEDEEENEIDLDEDEDDDEEDGLDGSDIHNLAYRDLENLNLTNDEHNLVIERERPSNRSDRPLKQQLKSICIITANTSYKNTSISIPVNRTSSTVASNAQRRPNSNRMDSTLLDDNNSVSKLKLGESSCSSSISSSKSSSLISAMTPTSVAKTVHHNHAHAASTNSVTPAITLNQNSTKHNLQQFNSSNSTNSLVSTNSNHLNNHSTSSAHRLLTTNTSTITASTSNSINDDASEVILNKLIVNSLQVLLF
jgi:hypothetical protein